MRAFGAERAIQRSIGRQTPCVFSADIEPANNRHIARPVSGHFQKQRFQVQQATPTPAAGRAVVAPVSPKPARCVCPEKTGFPDKSGPEPPRFQPDADRQYLTKRFRAQSRTGSADCAAATTCAKYQGLARDPIVHRPQTQNWPDDRRPARRWRGHQLAPAHHAMFVGMVYRATSCRNDVHPNPAPRYKPNGYRSRRFSGDASQDNSGLGQCRRYSPNCARLEYAPRPAVFGRCPMQISAEVSEFLQPQKDAITGAEPTPGAQGASQGRRSNQRPFRLRFRALRIKSALSATYRHAIQLPRQGQNRTDIA